MSVDFACGGTRAWHTASPERKVGFLSAIVRPAARVLVNAGTDLFQRRAVGSWFVRDERLGLPVPPHGFCEEFQCNLPVAPLGREALQHLALMIHGPPTAMGLTIDSHDHLVEVPPPAAGPRALEPTLPDLGRGHQADAVPPIADGFVADIDPAFVQQIFHIPQ